MKGRFCSRIYLLSILLLGSLLPLRGEERLKPLIPPPERLSFIPNPYFVGDRVTLRFRLETPTREELRPLSSNPTISWGVVQKVNLLPLEGKKGYEVTIVFIPYRTGRQLFPPLEFGSLRVDQISVEVSSLLETVREVPQPLREQAMIPYLNFLLVLAVGGVLSIPLCYLLWKRKLHAVLVDMWERHRGKYLYRQLNRKLDHLEGKISTMEPKIFYSTLQEHLRHYLSHRWTPKIIAYTTTEIGMYLERIKQEWVEDKSGYPSAALLEVFRRGDEVKFAGMQVDTPVLRSDLLVLRRVVDRVEQTFWERRRRRKG
jgi:hypothetical protein